MNANHNWNQSYHNLWTDGLICGFEFCRARRKQQRDSPENLLQMKQECKSGEEEEEHSRSYWRPIGWERLSELVQTVNVENDWESQNNAIDHEVEATVAELAAPYWERPIAGPTWWCHVDASHQGIASWLRNAQWLHPAVSVALRDESKLISERMKHIFYEVPVRVAGGLLFELLGQSAGDPFIEEDDIPIVLRSWQAQNFVVTALHVKGFASNISVLGITEVQEMLIAGGACIPRTVHELIAHLACRLARWDDRLFRKYIFGAADEVELMFMNKRMYEDLNLFTIILNQEIRRLSTQGEMVASRQRRDCVRAASSIERHRNKRIARRNNKEHPRHDQ
uniref:Uncharacterized protein n=1 Tax=Noccaea caerulescens TaxID=107243 RepID=A0A1J3J402_NOCCA